MDKVIRFIKASEIDIPSTDRRKTDGLITDEQLMQSLDNTHRGRLIRAKYKMVWETTAINRNDKLVISSWVPGDLPLDNHYAYRDSIFVKDFILVERFDISDDPYFNELPTSNSTYVHGGSSGTSTRMLTNTRSRSMSVRLRRLRRRRANDIIRMAVRARLDMDCRARGWRTGRVDRPDGLGWAVRAPDGQRETRHALRGLSQPDV